MLINSVALGLLYLMYSSSWGFFRKQSTDFFSVMGLLIFPSVSWLGE